MREGSGGPRIVIIILIRERDGSFGGEGGRDGTSSGCDGTRCARGGLFRGRQRLVVCVGRGWRGGPGVFHGPLWVCGRFGLPCFRRSSRSGHGQSNGAWE